MRCYGCGFIISSKSVAADSKCTACGDVLRFTSDDFLLDQYGAPGRDVRQGQVSMGRVVEQSIETHSIALIEAPVGSGKSDAYGVPAVLRAAARDQYDLSALGNAIYPILAEITPRPRIVISTAKKNLQHQIAEKDLPYICKRLGDSSIKIALHKGKGNYACRLKANHVLDPAEKQAFDAWLTVTTTEDLTEYPGRRPSFLYDVTAEDCVGKGCSYAQDMSCGYARSKTKARSADIVITNHHVVAFDLRYGPGLILGPYTTLILDEAHQAPASFRAACSDVLSQGASHRIIKQIDAAGVLGGFDKAITTAWNVMFAQLPATDGEIPRDPFGAAGDETSQLLSEMFAEAGQIAVSLGWSADKSWKITTIKDAHARAQLQAVLALKTSIGRHSATLNRAKNPDENTVLYVSTTDRKVKRLTLAPISVGKLVGNKIQLIPSTILTSATMAIGGRFDDIKHQLGLNWASYYDANGQTIPPKKIHELVLTSPFNYKEQALLYTPRHIPLPVGPSDIERSKYLLSLTNECSRLIQASNGNAFVLFTSKQDLLDVHARLLEEDLPNPLIIQEEDAATAFKEFMATPNSVLLGTKSFWEGVDVQGQKLQLVIITKLPFPPLTDPVLQARSRVYVAEQVANNIPLSVAQSNVFHRLQIPYMLTELRQGAGRLIRARTDYGVLAILDTRVFSGNSKDMPLPNQMSYRGYGKLAVDATGFTNHVFDYEIIARQLSKMLAREEKIRTASAQSCTTS